MSIKEIAERGLSSDCALGPMAVAIMLTGEHPCDRCNVDRAVCRGYPEIGGKAEQAKMEEV